MDDVMDSIRLLVQRLPAEAVRLGGNEKVKETTHHPQQKEMKKQ